jgi:hypothetical protein
MKSKFLSFLIILLPIVACKKSRPDPENVVVYTIVETSKNEPEYTVIYSTPQGDKTVGPIKQNSWLSKPLSEFERGDFVALSVQTKSGSGSFISSVYLNGVLLKEERMDYPYLKKLEAILPPSY